MSKRAQEVGWVVFHLADLEADFRAFYGLTPEDILEMTGPHFLDLAVRVVNYPGVLQAIAQEEHEKQNGRAPAVSGGDKFVEATPLNLQADPALAGLISYGTG